MEKICVSAAEELRKNAQQLEKEISADEDIIQAENKRLDNAGVLYITSDEEYNSMTLLNLQNKLTTFNSSNILLTSSARDILDELPEQHKIQIKNLLRKFLSTLEHQ
ncbi:Hypothetical predicted protein [Mytilus galloprovincialis]|uniref:Uncharacterized protein n=1 Tax=Mytilus galloprovincialis TaxID=29158 RepID=A0A8B6HAT4_MYTGA|nr:Hypothetical predicted protein [Mytilus galloprovincialis]